jgi:hypothetical protein
MSRVATRSVSLVLTVLIVGTGFVDAVARGPGKSETSTSTTTVTEVETEAKLAGAGSQTGAKGYAESTVVTVTNTSTSTSTTNSFLTVHVRHLTLTAGSTVTFQLNGSTIGTGTVKHHRAYLRLSTKKGDTVPTVNQGDTLTVLDPDGMTVDLTGTFDAPETETESGWR